MFKRILFSLFLATILVGAIVFLNTLTTSDGTNKLSGFAVQDKNTSKHESLIRQLQGDKSEQQGTITLMKVEIDESKDLISKLNSKIIGYEKQISLFEKENSEYRNEITSLKSESFDQQDSLEIINNAIDENGSMIKLLTNENTKHQNTINELRKENKLLEKYRENTYNTVSSEKTISISGLSNKLGISQQLTRIICEFLNISILLSPKSPPSIFTFPKRTKGSCAFTKSGEMRK